MSTYFRILCRGNDYRAQRRIFWFFWRDLEREFVDTGVSSCFRPKRYATYAQARFAIRAHVLLRIKIEIMLPGLRHYSFADGSLNEDVPKAVGS